MTPERSALKLERVAAFMESCERADSFQRFAQLVSRDLELYETWLLAWEAMAHGPTVGHAARQLRGPRDEEAAPDLTEP